MKDRGKKEGPRNSTRPTEDGRGAARVRPADFNGPQAGERIVILGGGITGLTVAWELSKTSELPVLLVEKNVSAGGLAGSFHRRDRIFDFGSHRIHEQYDPEVLAIIRELLGDELLKRPRRGQIRIQGKFLNYPPAITQVLTSFGLARGIRLVKDFLLVLFYERGCQEKGDFFLTNGMKQLAAASWWIMPTTERTCVPLNERRLAMSLNYTGIDVHKISSQVCTLTGDGELIERRTRTDRLPGRLRRTRR